MRHAQAVRSSFLTRFIHRPGSVLMLAALVLAAVFQGCGGGSGNTTELVPINTLVRWNGIALDAMAADHGGGQEQAGPHRSARAMAIVHIAMFETLITVNGGYASYLNVPHPGGDVSQSVAIAKAAHDTLASLYPAQAMDFADRLSEDLVQIEDGSRKNNGLTVGQAAASAILGSRYNDGSQVPDGFIGFDYFPGGAPGVWRPDPISLSLSAMGSSWAQVVPFTMLTGDQFRAPPPPDISSYDYAIAYLEAQTLGGDAITTPTMRTPAQSVAATYWGYDGTPDIGSTPRLFNQMAMVIGMQEGLGVMELGRMLALVNVGMAEGSIACFDSKYFYGYWRPVCAIREADPGTGPTGLGDGNIWTAGDTSFTPMGAPASNTTNADFTPPSPSYPCDHAVYGGAVFQVMRRMFGTSSIGFTAVSDELNGVTLNSLGMPRPLIPRHFFNLDQAEDESGQARVYLGVQFSFDKTAGIAQGNEVGNWVYDHMYQPIP
jgi:hypothetical protein